MPYPTILDRHGRPLQQTQPTTAKARRNALRDAIPARDLPVYQVLEADTVHRVRSALLGMEREGVFQDAALLVDAMGRDERIMGALQQRVDGMLELPFSMGPAGGERSTKRQRAVAEQCEADFNAAFTLEVQRDLETWGIMLGVGLAQLAPWGKGDKTWNPDANRVKVWHPMFIRWDWTLRCFMLQTEDQGEIPIQRNTGVWWLYTPYGYERGWMKSLVRRLALPFLARMWANRDFARYSERHGQPTVLGFTPSEATEEERRDFLKGLALIASETVVELPQLGADQGAGFKVDLLEATARSEALFTAFLGTLEKSIAIAINGQTLTSDSDGGGSYALGKVHRNVQHSIIKAGGLSRDSSCRQSYVLPWTRINYADESLAPWPTTNTTPPEDLSNEATTLKTAGDAAKSWQDAGAEVDVNALAARFNMPTKPPKAGEEQQTQGQIYGYHLEARIVKRDEARRRLGLPPIGGELGEQLLGPEDAPEVEAMKGEAEGTVKSGTSAAVALAGVKGALGRRLVALRADVPEDAPGGMDSYLEALAEEAERGARRAMRPTVSAVLSILDEAKSPGELRAALVQAYPKLSAVELAEYLHDLGVTAELAGRFEVSQEQE